jgi:hypothetical protein
VPEPPELPEPDVADVPVPFAVPVEPPFAVEPEEEPEVPAELPPSSVEPTAEEGAVPDALSVSSLQAVSDSPAATATRATIESFPRRIASPPPTAPAPAERTLLIFQDTAATSGVPRRTASGPRCDTRVVPL